MFRNEESASSEKLSIDTLKEKRSRKSWRKKMSSKVDACKDSLSATLVHQDSTAQKESDDFQWNF